MQLFSTATPTLSFHHYQFFYILFQSLFYDFDKFTVKPQLVIITFVFFVFNSKIIHDLAFCFAIILINLFLN